jgi:MoaD family protein
VTSVLQKVVGGRSVQGEGRTIGEVLDGINAQYPGFREQITQEDGSLHRFVNIYINDEDIRFMQQLQTPVSAGDVVSILPALAGGGLLEDASRSSTAALASRGFRAAPPPPPFVGSTGGHPQTPGRGAAPPSAHPALGDPMVAARNANMATLEPSGGAVPAKPGSA